MSVIDKATALKHSVSGSNINKIVCKASSRDLAGPKKKHIDFLINLTNSPSVSMPQLADMIGERLQNNNWIVAMKALITAHNLLTLGNEKYLQCMATRTNPFVMETFSDRSSVLASEMTRYIHKYSAYLSYYCLGYRSTVLDIYRMPRGEQSPLRSLEPVKLIKACNTFQEQLDLLIDFDVSSSELSNGVINTAFLMLYKDLIKLYSIYNDAVIGILETFFEMKKTQCREAIEVYRKFLTRQEGVQRVLQLAESVGFDQKTHVNLRQVPADLLGALEQHLSEMDVIRKSASTQRPSPQIKAASERLTELKDQPSPSSGKTTPTSFPLQLPSANEEALEAQKKRFEELKKRASDKKFDIEEIPVGGVTSHQTPTKPTEDDEFDQMAASRSTPQLQQKMSVMDDLLGLEGGFKPSKNPWETTPTSSLASGASPNPFQPKSDPWNSGGGGGGYQEVSLFQQSTTTTTSNGMGGDLLQPVSLDPFATNTATNKPIKPLSGDIDSSLAQTAATLDLSGGVSGTKHQWSNPTPQQTTLTGGPSYQRPQIMQPTTLPPQPPVGSMGQPMGAMGSMGGMYGNTGYFPPQPQMFGGGMQPGYQWGQPYQPMGGAPAPGGMYAQNSFYNTPRQPFF